MMSYIDPGTGSMLFTVLIGVFSAGAYFFRDGIAKAGVLLAGGKAKQTRKDHVPFAIFSDSKRYWPLFAPICDEFERRELPLLYLTASDDDPALETNYRFVRCEFSGQGNRTYARLNYLSADVVLSTTPGLDVYQWKRSKDVKRYVHVPHAASDITIYRMFGLDYYDAVLLSGAYQIDQIRQLEQLRQLPAKEMELVGLPILDGMRRRLEQAEPLPPHPTTVLLAPSWGQSSIFGRYGGRMIRALLDTDCHVIVRPHPQSFVSEKAMMDRLMKEFPASDRLEWNRDNDNFEVLRRSDLLISDFSGVIFDFALVFQKPVIYADTAFDKSPYDACWLDEELWTFRTLPKIGRPLQPEDLDHLQQIITQTLESPAYRRALEQARAETWAHPGESVGRIVDYLVRTQAAVTAG